MGYQSPIIVNFGQDEKSTGTANADENGYGKNFHCVLLMYGTS